MLILRLLFILSALAIVLFGGMYLFTNNRRYLILAWQIARFILFAVLIFAVLFILERYVLIAWRVLI
jgi:hypothetical protein